MLPACLFSHVCCAHIAAKSLCTKPEPPRRMKFNIILARCGVLNTQRRNAYIHTYIRDVNKFTIVSWGTPLECFVMTTTTIPLWLSSSSCNVLESLLYSHVGPTKSKLITDWPQFVRTQCTIFHWLNHSEKLNTFSSSWIFYLYKTLVYLVSRSVRFCNQSILFLFLGKMVFFYVFII